MAARDATRVRRGRAVRVVVVARRLRLAPERELDAEGRRSEGRGRAEQSPAGEFSHP